MIWHHMTFLLLASFATCTSASAVDVVGGPEYDAKTRTGYTEGFSRFPTWRLVVNNVAIGRMRPVGPQASLESGAIAWGKDLPPIELKSPLLEGVRVAAIYPWSINPSRAIVGMCTVSKDNMRFGTRALLWSAPAAAPVVLEPLGIAADGRSDASAQRINAAGTIAGTSRKPIQGDQWLDCVVRWDSGSIKPVELETFEAAPDYIQRCDVVGINVSGMIAATVTHRKSAGQHYSRALRWPAGETKSQVLLPLMAGARELMATAQANAINDRGVVVGESARFHLEEHYYDGHHAVRWDRDIADAIELNSLDAPRNRASSSAQDINATGTIVGYGETPLDDKFQTLGIRPIRWQANRLAAEQLPLLGVDATGHGTGHAYSINDAGIIVGDSTYLDAANESKSGAACWMPNAKPILLNTLIDPGSGWDLIDATSISNTCWITGSGLFDPDGPGPLPPYRRLYLLKLDPS